MAGIHAPDWAKHRGGKPVKMRDTRRQRRHVPRFWTGKFGKAYAALQKKLAARYDGNTTLAEVVISRCTTFYAEPFIRQTSITANRKALKRAGYTKAKDQACHKAQINAHRVWKRTRAGLAFNPAQFVTGNGGRTVNDSFTQKMMRYCRSASVAAACWRTTRSARPSTVLDPAKAPALPEDVPGDDQAQPVPGVPDRHGGRMGNCERTLDWAADRGASYVELPWNAADAGCTTAVLREAARVWAIESPPRPSLRRGDGYPSERWKSKEPDAVGSLREAAVSRGSRIRGRGTVAASVALLAVVVFPQASRQVRAAAPSSSS